MNHKKTKPKNKSTETKGVCACARASYCRENGKPLAADVAARVNITLDLVTDGGSINASLQAGGFSWNVWNGLLAQYPTLRDAWHVRIQAAAEIRQIRREEEADRRGIEGWDEPVYQGGILAGYVRRYSDTLLLKQLAAHDPEKYADRVKQEHSGAGGGPIALCAFPPEPKTAEEWEAQWHAHREKKAKLTEGSTHRETGTP